jgi:hypothetical protein
VPLGAPYFQTGRCVVCGVWWGGCQMTAADIEHRQGNDEVRGDRRNSKHEEERDFPRDRKRRRRSFKLQQAERSP